MTLDVESVSTYERFKMAPISTRTALKMYKDTRSSRTKTTELEYASVPCSYYDWQTVSAVNHHIRINNGEVMALGASKMTKSYVTQYMYVHGDAIISRCKIAGLTLRVVLACGTYRTHRT